ncbi:MAG TPA: hypothetical protein VGT06_03455 [Candidatus Methylomirabilis sp.]|jgi:hypothetical protein|nr:hypothetical protein [Candidatus Methylomirabilis sp.]
MESSERPPAPESPKTRRSLEGHLGMATAGFSDGAVAEIIAGVVQKISTDYFTRVAQTEVDFPAAVLTSKRVA